MELFPAIDLREGRVVRLTRGDYDKMTVYGADPCAQADAFRRAGARCLHLVDLDGARDGVPANVQAIRAIVEQGGLYVEVGGGIRTQAQIERYLELGVGRCILGSAAVTDFAFAARMLRTYGSRLAVGVDLRQGMAVIHGWREDSGVEGLAFCRRLADAGCTALIVTDISRDGAMQGTNLDLYRQLCGALPGVAVTASGGITRMEELEQLERLGAAAAILGKSLYTGALDLAECLERLGRGKGDAL